MNRISKRCLGVVATVACTLALFDAYFQRPVFGVGYTVLDAICRDDTHNVCAACSVAMETTGSPPILTIVCYAHKCDGGNVTTKFCEHDNSGKSDCPGVLGANKECLDCEKWKCNVINGPANPDCTTVGPTGANCRCPPGVSGDPNGDITRAVENCT